MSWNHAPVSVTPLGRDNAFGAREIVLGSVVRATVDPRTELAGNSDSVVGQNLIAFKPRGLLGFVDEGFSFLASGERFVVVGWLTVHRDTEADQGLEDFICLHTSIYGYVLAESSYIFILFSGLVDAYSRNHASRVDSYRTLSPRRGFVSSTYPIPFNASRTQTALPID
jgi:hypothetical protein